MPLGPFVRSVCACGGMNRLLMLGGHPCQSEAVETFGSCERSGQLKGGISVWASPPTSEESIGLQHADPGPHLCACSVPGTSAYPSSYCRPHRPSQRQLCYRNDSLDEDLRLKRVKWFFSLSSPALTASTAWHFPRCLPLGMVRGRFACRLVNKSARGKQELLAQMNWSEAACALLVPQKAYADNRSFVVARGGPRHLGTHSCG